MKKMRPVMIWVTVALAIILPLVTSYIYSSSQDLSLDGVSCDSAFSFMNSGCKDGILQTPEEQSLENKPAGESILNSTISGKNKFSVMIYLGDKNGKQMNEVFGGEQEVGHYFLWIKNTGYTNAACTYTTNRQDTATKIITSKEMFMIILKPGQNASRVFAFDGFDPSIDDLAPEVRCVGEEGQVIMEKPIIQKFYWKRFLALDGDYENPQDTAKKIIIGDSLNLERSGIRYNFTAVENVQNEDCTIKYNDQRYRLQPYTTQKISDFKVTLVESGFKYCSILFW